MRSPKPWYRKQKKSWCVYLNGSLVTLAQGKANKKAAETEFHKLMLHGGKMADDKLRLAEVCDLFLDHSLREHAQATYDQNKYFLEALANHKGVGRVRVPELKPHHLTRWLQDSAWNDTSKNKAIGAAKQAFNWCKAEGHIKTNPFVDVKRPRAKRRERILTPDERAKIFRKIKGQGFRDYLTALEETGARPGEIARLTAEDIDFKKNVAVLWRHKTGKKTGKPRILFLTPNVRAICKRLVKLHPTGVIFRTMDGEPWSKNSLNCRFRRLREKYPELKGVSAYVLRHSYCSNALERGIPIATVAELMGHASSDITERVYAHLNQKGDYLAQMARKAIAP